MTIPVKIIFVSVFMLVSTGCLNPFVRNADFVDVGPNARFDLVVYFKAGTTGEQIESFNQNVLWEPRPDGRGERSRGGINSYLRLTPEQANGHWGFAVNFDKNATQEQRNTMKGSIASNELVQEVFENVAPKDIKESDIK